MPLPLALFHRFGAPWMPNPGPAMPGTSWSTSRRWRGFSCCACSSAGTCRNGRMCSCCSAMVLDVGWNPLAVIYSLVNIQKTMERSTIFHGKTHYKWPCSIATLNYQRVTSRKWSECTHKSSSRQRISTEVFIFADAKIVPHVEVATMVWSWWMYGKKNGTL